MRKDVQRHFSEKAAVYDSNRRNLIPNFDEFYRVGVDALACNKPDPRVLDIGAGTGLSTLYLLQRFPQARVTLLDFSQEMLAVAQERFANNPNISFITGDYRSHPLEGPFDVVISGLSIHHLSFEEKQELTKRIFGLLVPTGEFFNADMVKGQSEALEQEMNRREEKFLRQALTEEEVQRFFQGSQYMDIPITLAEHLTLLREAGFKVVDCIYRYWIYGVFYGQR